MTLISTLQLLSEIQSPNVEFVISDNSDIPVDFDDFKIDPRFKIYRPNKSLGMTQNWEFCLAQATGQWRGFVGDDDGVVPSGIDALIFELESNKFTELVTTQFASYVWPSQTGEMGVLNFTIDNGFGKETKKRIVKCLKKVKLLNEFPVPYSKSIFNETLETKVRMVNGGNFFSSRIPDINSGAELTISCERIEYFNQVCFISGVSNFSNGHLFQTDPTGIRATEFHQLSSTLFHPALGDGTGPMSYIVILEPIAQAFLKSGKDIIPSPATIIRKSLFSTKSTALMKKYCLETWPDQKSTVEIYSFFAKHFYALITRLKSRTHLLFWLLFEKRSLMILRSLQMHNIYTAGKCLEEINQLSNFSTGQFQLNINVHIKVIRSLRAFIAFCLKA
jgi:hypothetical protein